MTMVESEKDAAQKEWGVPVVFREDPSMNVLGKLEYGRHHESPVNVVRYIPGRTFTPHYMMHELMRLRLFSTNTASGVGKVVHSDESTRKGFADRFGAQFRPLRQRLGHDRFADFYSSLYDGLVSRAMNSPVDLMVEDMIYKRYPGMRPLQLLSLLQQERDNAEADRRGSAMKELPRVIVDATRMMNIIQALQFRDLFGVDTVREHGPSRREMEGAQSLYEEYLAYREDYKPGDEYDLMEYFLQELHLQGLLLISPEDEFLGRPEDVATVLPTETEQERKEREFQEANRDGEDPAKTMMMAMYMVEAMEYMVPLPKEQVRRIAFEAAMLGTRGISPDGRDYCIPSLPGRGFGGYEMLAWYYVSWALTAPEAVDSLNLPFSAAYRSAVQMYRAKKGKG